MDRVSIEEIKRPVAQAVAEFHANFESVLLSRSEWLQQAVEHLSQSAGKMVRPIMTTLMAGMMAGRVPDKSVDAAILLELIHTATLIHDDVIDEAKTRRGKPTLGAIFDNRIAVLMGDFVLSSALIGAIQLQDLRIMAVVSQIGRELTEGEIRQMETAEKQMLSEETYLEVIRQKTAVLFESCAEVAAITCEASPEVMADFMRIGNCLGMAFQIRDDIFDYHTDDIGKPTGNDIREGKITLPLLHALLSDKDATEEAKRCHSYVVERSYTSEHIAELISFAHDRGGITYAHARMQAYIDECFEILARYPESPYRSSLEALARYIVERTK